MKWEIELLHIQASYLKILNSLESLPFEKHHLYHVTLTLEFVLQKEIKFRLTKDKKKKAMQASGDWARA